MLATSLVLTSGVLTKGTAKWLMVGGTSERTPQLLSPNPAGTELARATFAAITRDLSGAYGDAAVRGAGTATLGYERQADALSC